MVDRKNLHAQVKLMVTASEDRKGPTFGKGAATLLHGIEDNGSLNKTAKNLHMAYSKAWSMIKKVEEGLGFQLIDRYGARGSKLTDDGREFLKLYDAYEKKIETYAEKSFREIFKDF
jgi:molybdate transport system regulatory protein